MRLMLDTNTVSHLLCQHPQVLHRFALTAPGNLSISCITEAELLYGVAKKKSHALRIMVLSFLQSITVYSWDSEAAIAYGKLRAAMEKRGKSMGDLDQLIAAHAISRNARIVTSDRAFTMVQELDVEDWTQTY